VGDTPPGDAFPASSSWSHPHACPTRAKTNGLALSAKRSLSRVVELVASACLSRPREDAIAPSGGRIRMRVRARVVDFKSPTPGTRSGKLCRRIRFAAPQNIGAIRVTTSYRLQATS
jgi:hypothetical protein